MRYRVNILYSASETVDVEADSREAAIEAAYEQSHASLCNQCANHLDLGDPNGEIVADAVTGEEIPAGSGVDAP